MINWKKYKSLFLLLLLIVVGIIFLIIFLRKEQFYNKHNKIRLFHWNIHYNCFTSNDGNCDYKNGKNVKQRIMDKYFENIDFGNLIQFEENQLNKTDKNYNKYRLHNPKIHNINCNSNCDYLSLIHSCGDYNVPLNLVYNNKKWTLLNHKSGCIVPKDKDSRPYIIGEFKSKKIKNKENENEKFKVFVICVYMQHPWDLDPASTFTYINKSLQEMKFDTNKDNVIFMSDTNLLNYQDNALVLPKNIRADNISTQQFYLNQYIMEQISKKPLRHQYKDPTDSKTCCNDDVGFKYNYDRIITNFGYISNSNIVCNYELEKRNENENENNKIPVVKYTNEMHRPIIMNVFIE